ncbi:hypothetical protein BCR34DRAFT_494278, partial [Clohesyomyces aquaticus]
VDDAVGEILTTFYDSGLRCGAGSAKALALGEDCVLFGRPYVYGLALKDEGGVSDVLKSFVGDLELMPHMAGIPSGNKTVLDRPAPVREDNMFNSEKGIGIH